MDSGQVRCRSVGRVGRGVGAAPRAGGRRAAARHSGPDPRERSRRAAGRRPGLPVVWSGWMPAGTRKPPWPPRGLSRRGLRAVLSRPPAAVRLLRDAVAALAGFSRCSGLRDARRRTGVAAAFGRARAERGIVEPAGRTGARGQSRSRCRSDAGSGGHATRHDAPGPRPSEPVTAPKQPEAVEPKPEIRREPMDEPQPQPKPIPAEPKPIPAEPKPPAPESKPRPEDENLFEVLSDAAPAWRAPRRFAVGPAAVEATVAPNGDRVEPVTHLDQPDPKRVPRVPFDPAAETRRLRATR